MNNTFIEVDPNFVLENCEKVLLAIDAMRTKEVEEVCSKLVGTKVGFLYKKTLNTIEEAIEYDRKNQEFGMPSRHYEICLNAEMKKTPIVELKQAAMIAKEENKNFYASIKIYSIFLKYNKEFV